MSPFLQFIFALIATIGVLAGLLIKWKEIRIALKPLEKRFLRWSDRLRVAYRNRKRRRRFFLQIGSAFLAVACVILIWHIVESRKAALELRSIPGNLEQHLLEFFKTTQTPRGSWTHQSESNVVVELVYTSQVLIALSQLDVSSEYAAAVVEPAISFLLPARAGSDLLDIYVKYDALFSWPDLVPEDTLRNHLLLHTQTNFHEYGARIHASTFELCLITQTLRQGAVFERLNEHTQVRLSQQLEEFLETPISLVFDISHYAWALELNSRNGRPVEEHYLAALKKGLIGYPRRGGLFELNADRDLPSRTPALRSDEFLTAHLILSTSRILQRHYDQEVYEILRDAVRTFTMRFNNFSLWETRSYLLAQPVDADPYFAALIFRSLVEISRVSESGHREGLIGTSNLIVDPGNFTAPHPAP